MPRRKPIPAARRQFAQRPGLLDAMPAGARSQMQKMPSQMPRAQARNPMAGRAEARPGAGAARRQMPLSEELPSMGERASTRPAGLKADWHQSFWFQIPFLGQFVDLLRSLVYPQEHLRTMKRAFVGTGIGSIAKDRMAARIEQRRQEKLVPRQQALVQRNRATVPRNTIAGQRETIARRQAHGNQNYPRQKAA